MSVLDRTLATRQECLLFIANKKNSNQSIPLNGEMQTKIVSFLHFQDQARFSIACREFLHSSLDVQYGPLQTSKNIFFIKNRVYELMGMQKSLENIPFDLVRKLTISFLWREKTADLFQFRTDEEIVQICQLVPRKLESLDFVGMVDMDARVAPVVSHFPALQEANFSNSSISDTGLRVVAEHCSKLTALNLDRCRRITDVGFVEVMPLFSELQALSLGACRIPEGGLVAVMPRFSGLQALDLSCCRITDVSLEAINQYCLQLQDLTLSVCRGFTDVGLQTIATNCRLQSLNLSSCTQITSIGYNSVAQHCTILDLSYCDQITDECIAAVLSMGCNNLTSLNLEGCMKITDNSLFEIDKYNQQLKSVRVSFNCPGITCIGKQQLKPVLELKRIMLPEAW